MNITQLTEEQISQAVEKDSLAIAFRERIEKIDRLLGKTYAESLTKQYEMYIKHKYKFQGKE